MKTNLLLYLCLAVLLPACVQKTYRRTVVYTLHFQVMKTPEKVSIRGNDKPLSWESDLDMSLTLPDSTYRAVVTYQTGYKFTEVKFVANGVFELPDQPNRRVVFSDTDTTFYEATFDKRNPATIN
jgi:hypothetical protein